MVEPGTAAIAVLSTISGIAGYGAMKLNSKQDLMIEQKVNERIRDVKDLLKATQDAKAIADTELKKRQIEVERLTQELDVIRKAKQGLEILTEGERLYKTVKLNVLRAAVKDFRSRPAVVSFQDRLTPEQKDATNKVFDGIEKLNMISLSRGSLFTFHRDLSNAAGRDFLSRSEFDRLFVECLKQAQVAPPAPAPEPPTPEPPASEPEAQERNVPVGEIEQCKQKLDSLNIKSLKDYRKWMGQNRDNPEVPNVNNCVDVVLKGVKGGIRNTRRIRKHPKKPTNGVYARKNTFRTRRD